jgi:hypothetical protein
VIPRKTFPDPTPWSEAQVQRALVRSEVFKSQVLAVPCCSWTGHEADLLVIGKCLRLCDVEVKISRADLKADWKKEKWWHSRPWSRTLMAPTGPRIRRDWPPKVWKHYYCMPRSIWHESLLEHMPPNSGILFVYSHNTTGKPVVSLYRRPKPNRDAQTLLPNECIDIARLASLRMWDALAAKN